MRKTVSELRDKVAKRRNYLADEASFSHTNRNTMAARQRLMIAQNDLIIRLLEMIGDHFVEDANEHRRQLRESQEAIDSVLNKQR